MRKAHVAKLIGIAAVIPVLLTTAAGSANASTSAPYIGYGYNMTDHAVWCLQESLNYFQQHSNGNGSFPYAIPTLSQDGVFGPQTEQAVEYFQRDVSSLYGGLQADGIVGQRTGTAVMGWGDPYYVGYQTATHQDRNAYCYQYIPTTY